MAPRLKCVSLGEAGKRSHSLRGERGDTTWRICPCVFSCVASRSLTASREPSRNFISSPPGWKNSGYLYGSGATRWRYEWHLLLFWGFFSPCCVWVAGDLVRWDRERCTRLIDPPAGYHLPWKRARSYGFTWTDESRGAWIIWEKEIRKFPFFFLPQVLEIIYTIE